MRETQEINSINALFEPFDMKVDEVINGAQIVRYNLKLPLDVKKQGKIRRAEKDIQYSLSTVLNCDEVIYGKTKDHVYVERKADTFKPIDFKNLVARLPQKGYYLLLGEDIDGKLTYTNLRKAPHILVAGTTGSGKSELLHTFIASLIFRRKENPCEIYIIDPKRAEYNMYKDRNGVYLITETSEAVEKLKFCVDVMEKRYRMLEAHVGAKDIDHLNDSSIHPIVIVIDELKDLLMQDSKAEQYIVRLAQKARACGIHLILGTQSPRADVITGGIKCNVPTKIALHTSNQLESRIILDQNGAESLFGKGDMLFLGNNGTFVPTRIQAAYINDYDKQRLADAIPYEKHAIEEVEEVENSFGTPEWQKRFDAELEEIRRKRQQELPKPVPEQPKKKRLGLFGTMAALMKVKPIMFQSDEYPPRI